MKNNALELDWQELHSVSLSKIMRWVNIMALKYPIESIRVDYNRKKKVFMGRIEYWHHGL